MEVDHEEDPSLSGCWLACSPLRALTHKATSAAPSAGPRSTSIAPAPTSCDTSDTGYKVWGGYRFANQFAVELVYFDWGKAKASGTLDTIEGRSRDVPMATGTFSGDLTAEGFGLGVAYFLPFSPQWSGVARLGVTQTTPRSPSPDWAVFRTRIRTPTTVSALPTTSTRTSPSRPTPISRAPSSVPKARTTRPTCGCCRSV